MFAVFWLLTLPVTMPLLPREIGRYVPRTRRGRVYSILAGMMLATCFCIYLALRTPGWYRPADPTDLEVIDVVGSFEPFAFGRYQGAINSAATARSTLTYTQKEINAVLAITYSNASGSYRGQVAAPMVCISENQLTIGARAIHLPVVGSAVISLSGHAEVMPSPSAGDVATRCRIVLDSVHVGSLRVPQFLIRDRLAKSLGDSLDSLAKTLIGAAEASSAERPGRRRTISPADLAAILEQIKRGEPFVVPTRLERKTVYLQAITLTPGRLSITFAPTPLK